MKRMSSRAKTDMLLLIIVVFVGIIAVSISSMMSPQLPAPPSMPMTEGTAGNKATLDDAIDRACQKLSSKFMCSISGMPLAETDYNGMKSLIQLCMMNGLGVEGTHTAKDMNECMTRCGCPPIPTFEDLPPLSPEQLLNETPAA